MVIVRLAITSQSIMLLMISTFKETMKMKKFANPSETMQLR